MARPKANSSIPSARDRIEDAFWEMLASTPFSQITVSAISAKAGVNHNTFYYHFSSIEDLAEKVFKENMLPELPTIMLPVLSGVATEAGGALNPDKLSFHFRRARLYAASDSSLLTGILRDSITRLWLDAAGIDESQLLQPERDQLAFIFGGVVSMIANMGEDADVGRMEELVESPLGKGILTSLSAIATRGRG